MESDNRDKYSLTPCKQLAPNIWALQKPGLLNLSELKTVVSVKVYEMYGLSFQPLFCNITLLANYIPPAAVKQQRHISS